MFIFIHTCIYKSNFDQKFPNIQRDARLTRGHRQFVHCFSHLTIFYQISPLKFICAVVSIEKRASIENEEFIFHSNGQFSVPTFMPGPLFRARVYVCVCLLRCSPFIVLRTALAIIVIKINVSLLFFLLLLLMYAKLLINMNSNAYTITDRAGVNRIESHRPHVWLYFNLSFLLLFLYESVFLFLYFFFAFFALKTVN